MHGFGVGSRQDMTVYCKRGLEDDLPNVLNIVVR